MAEREGKKGKRSRSRSTSPGKDRDKVKDRDVSPGSDYRVDEDMLKRAEEAMDKTGEEFEFFENLDDLPGRVKAHLPTHAQHIFMNAFDNAMLFYQNPEKRQDPAKDPRRVAYAVAWNAVKTKYHKDDDGKWVENEESYKMEEEDPKHSAIERTDDPEKAAQEYKEYRAHKLDEKREREGRTGKNTSRSRSRSGEKPRNAKKSKSPQRIESSSK